MHRLEGDFIQNVPWDLQALKGITWTILVSMYQTPLRVWAFLLFLSTFSVFVLSHGSIFLDTCIEVVSYTSTFCSRCWLSCHALNSSSETHGTVLCCDCSSVIAAKAQSVAVLSCLSEESQDRSRPWVTLAFWRLQQKDHLLSLYSPFRSYITHSIKSIWATDLLLGGREVNALGHPGCNVKSNLIAYVHERRLSVMSTVQ